MRAGRDTQGWGSTACWCLSDWDVHHGNGTQATFWADPASRLPVDPSLAVLPRHGAGRTKRVRATRWGTTLQSAHRIRHASAHGIRAGVPRRAGTLRGSRPPAIGLAWTQASIVTRLIRLARWASLEIEDFEPLSDIVLDVADTYAGGRLVSVLEGGYNPSILASCVEVHLRRFLDRAPKPAS